VPGAGHFLPDEQPDAVAAALTGFVGGDASAALSSRDSRPVM
jgi:hypothetical protein